MVKNMREIGSEFWTQYEPRLAECANNEAYLLSGRTALRFIVNDITKSKNVHKVLLPSYCCDSMILPFVESGLDVQFYKLYPDGIAYPDHNDADIVLLIDFFGCVLDENAEIARREKQAGKTIIYDATHKIDANAAVEAWSDYTFCSYRKWFYCNFAKVTKHHGAFSAPQPTISNDHYVRLRDEAASEKKKYLSGEPADKDVFLSKFGAAEQLLETDYEGYAGIPVTIDFDEIISKRKENASFLLGELQKIPQIGLWRNEVKSCDTPMFVPILVEPNMRDELRSYLISQKICCPIHWPNSPYHKEHHELFDRELSLICDQRYDISDMQRLVLAIKEFVQR